MFSEGQSCVNDKKSIKFNLETFVGFGENLKESITLVAFML